MSALGRNSGDATYQVRAALHRRRATFAAALAVIVTAAPVMPTAAAPRPHPDTHTSHDMVQAAATTPLPLNMLAEVQSALDWAAMRPGRVLATPPPTPAASPAVPAAAASPESVKTPPPRKKPAKPRPPRVSHTPVHTAAPDGSAAAVVVRYALAQVGKPYRFATAGPAAFDCSGLTKAAYAQVGISIPHQTGGIIGRGRPVERSQLAAGDLVFWPGHVAIYISDGRVVEAANSRTGVVARKIWGNPTAYRRLL